MKRLFYIFFLFVASKSLIAQTQSQEAFVDSCNEAISLYKDFLIKQAKGQSSFEKGIKLFNTSYKQLLDLKSLNQIDAKSYENLKIELENVTALDFKTVMSKMQQQKEKHNILINETIVSLTGRGVGFLIYLDFINIDLKNFQKWAKVNSSKILNLLENSLHIQNIYFLKYDSLLSKLKANKVFFKIKKIKKSWDQYEQIITIYNTNTFAILDKYRPDSIDLFISSSKFSRCIWYYTMPDEFSFAKFNDDISKYISLDEIGSYNLIDDVSELHFDNGQDWDPGNFFNRDSMENKNLHRFDNSYFNHWVFCR